MNKQFWNGFEKEAGVAKTLGRAVGNVEAVPSAVKETVKRVKKIPNEMKKDYVAGKKEVVKERNMRNKANTLAQAHQNNPGQSTVTSKKILQVNPQPVQTQSVPAVAPAPVQATSRLKPIPQSPAGAKVFRGKPQVAAQPTTPPTQQGGGMGWKAKAAIGGATATGVGGYVAGANSGTRPEDTAPRYY